MKGSLMGIITLFLLFGLSTCLDWVKIDNNTKQFVDSQGRAMIFHGVNAVYKLPPFIPTIDHFDFNSSLSEDDAKNLSKWGINIVRLGIEWAGLLIDNKTINDTYLTLMDQIISTLSNYGIYTLIDNHQDSLSRYFCGEGMPDYIEKTLTPALQFPKPLISHIEFEPNGYPTLASCLKHDFAEFYFSDKVVKAFQDIYSNNTFIQHELLRYWDIISKHYGNNSNVIGYELINEPIWGDIYKYPKDLLESGYSDHMFLQPLYDKLNSIIRANDNNHIIFFEPMVFDLGESGFTDVPGGKSYQNKSAFSFHLYCPFVNKSGSPPNEFICKEFDKVTMNAKNKDSLKLGVPRMLTEFGALGPFKNGIKEANSVMALADTLKIGYIYWTFKHYEDITTMIEGDSECLYYKNGTLQIDKVKALSRTYPKFVAGNLLDYSYNPDNKEFSMSYKVTNSSQMGVSIVYFNKELNYPNDIEDYINEPSVLVMEAITNYDSYLILKQNKELQEGFEIKFSIKPKSQLVE